jgi:hypothetical protein
MAVVVVGVSEVNDQWECNATPGLERNVMHNRQNTYTFEKGQLKTTLSDSVGSIFLGPL